MSVTELMNLIEAYAGFRAAYAYAEGSAAMAAEREDHLRRAERVKALIRERLEQDAEVAARAEKANQDLRDLVKDLASKIAAWDDEPPSEVVR